MYKFVNKRRVSRYFQPIDKTQYVKGICNDNYSACIILHRWLDSPTEVNAYYTPQFNQFGKNICNG